MLAVSSVLLLLTLSWPLHQLHPPASLGVTEHTARVPTVTKVQTDAAASWLIPLSSLHLHGKGAARVCLLGEEVLYAVCCVCLLA